MASRLRFSSMKRYFYLTLGCLFFAIGMIGTVVPILPTTPFLLVTLSCFAKSSNRFHSWLIKSKIYEKHLASFVENRAMTLKHKLCIVIPVTILLIITGYFSGNLPIRITIGAVLLAKYYYFFFRIRTISSTTNLPICQQSYHL